MRQEPIELSLAAGTPRKRRAAQIGRSADVGMAPEASVVDEAFARFDGVHNDDSRRENGDRRMMKQALVSDLAAQLEAIDRQRERLTRLLESVETRSIAD
jgi:hypothetical protein